MSWPDIEGCWNSAPRARKRWRASAILAARDVPPRFGPGWDRPGGRAARVAAPPGVCARDSNRACRLVSIIRPQPDEERGILARGGDESARGRARESFGPYGDESHPECEVVRVEDHRVALGLEHAGSLSVARALLANRPPQLAAGSRALLSAACADANMPVALRACAVRIRNCIESN